MRLELCTLVNMGMRICHANVLTEGADMVTATAYSYYTNYTDEIRYTQLGLRACREPGEISA